MVRVEKSYIVWFWDRGFRIGKTFKTKSNMEKFVKSLKCYQHIGTTVSIKIIDDDVA